MYQKIIVIFILLFSFATAALAGSNQPVIMDEAAMVWKQLLVAPDLHYTVLAGNPDKKEFFVVRLKLPKDYSDVIHTHASPRYDTVISGAYYLAYGDQIDKSKTTKIAAGSFTVCPAKAKHFGYTEEETVIQISGIGPWEALKTAGPNR